MACDVVEQALSAGHATGYALVVIGLLCLSGLAAGLTLGLLSLDCLNLEVLKRTGTRAEKKWADKVRSACSDMSL
jgi:metal transporter CNNM